MLTEQGKKIKALMALAGISGAEIARTLGVHRSAVSKVADGVMKSRRIREAIARDLKTRVHDLWPDPGVNR